MFSTPIKPNKNWEEGIVTEVDAKRLICKVKTTFGKDLPRVKYMLDYGGSSRSGDRGTPSRGDQVVISYDLGYPLIIGSIPKVQDSDSDYSQEMIDATTSVDTGNFSGTLGASATVDVNKPKDFIAGDRVISSIGGGFLALLRGGSVLLRSGPFSEIFVSKLANLVRVVSGNWEHFTDVCSDTIKNYRGRVFRFIGYTNTYLNSKTEAYQYNEYYGDTALAETLKTNYNVDIVPPAVSNIIKKEQILAGGVEAMHRTIALDGTEETVVTTTGGVTKLRSNGTQLYLSHNDNNYIIIDDAGLHLIEKTGALITLLSGVVTVQDSGGAKGVFSAGTINLTDAGGGTCNLAGGVVTLKAVGGATMTLSGVNTTIS